MIDLNSATAQQLRKVRGIGEVLSERIIRYKLRIQGFSTMDQLDEVYGLSPEVLVQLKLHFSLDSLPEISKISLATVSRDELVQIPYLDRQQANAIILYSTKNDSIKLNDLPKIKELDSVQIQRLALYLF